MQIDIRRYKPSQLTAGIINQLYEKDRELERIREIVYDYQSRILKENFWKNESEVEQYAGLNITVEEHIITDPEHTFLLSTENLRRFRRLCYHAAIREGFRVRKPEDCPLMKCDSERALIKDRLIERLVIELEEQRIIFLRGIRTVNPSSYTEQIENLIKDLLYETARRRQLREVRAQEVRLSNSKKRAL